MTVIKVHRVNFVQIDLLNLSLFLRLARRSQRDARPALLGGGQQHICFVNYCYGAAIDPHLRHSYSIKSGVDYSTRETHCGKLQMSHLIP